MVQQLVSNAAILLAGFYIISLVYKEPITKELSTNRKMVIGIWAGLLGFALMIFGIPISNNVIVDLRHIPIIMVGFYGGPIPAIVSAIIISASRFLISVNSAAIMAGIVMMLIGIITALFSKRLEKFKIWGVFILNVIACGFVVVNLHLILAKEANYWLNMSIFVVISLVIGVIAAGLMSNMIKSKQLFQKYEQDSTLDYLTRLSNVRQFDEKINHVMDAGSRQVTLMLIDIDYFKNINDTYGHDAGDAILKQLAAILKASTTDGSEAFRNGGEEFSIVLLDCSIDEGNDVAERVRKETEENDFIIPNGQIVKITISVGVSGSKDGANTSEGLFKSADEALYKAKLTGRNRVCIADDN
ncbi:diguanylate cyclase [Listeria cossartiae subsp. cayugensis]|uniref:GGDEF domain-containing protein n=1 Tax=Listeria cossartiae TaxID=2838249 RepID=UPI0016233A2A|nr:diguanylate cyclase [Listeria cossartiae]MBC1807511.1 diguanylate cyclase [Listeria cossartiae subsp. cayugensis]MDT0000479.1 diguanylate cyclase [Listeria cossartiae subsp. cayugensis]MDT0003678.1 diguanylate cyclase [Listeria cossartiae subsp. cayugensis]MDT0008433.1 diguanylate cyclase [Listeria cossartiae subsp. cayugensis]MDT0014625.1 diguanylate cyclase [Listeria cossartiae subsp. cayugensis]